MAAYQAGRASFCLGALNGHEGVEASLLRTRALLRLNRGHDAYDELAATIPHFGDHRRSAEHQFLLGTTLARRREFEDAAEAIANAEVYATSSGDAELIAEAFFYKALTAFMRGDAQAAESVIADALDERTGSPHARMLELLGLVAGLRGDVDRQMAMHLAACRHVARLDQRDAFLEANMLNNLAIPVAELHPPELVAYVRQRAGEIEWNDELRTQRFHVVHHLAWLDALAGNHLLAYRNFKLAIGLAPSPARKAEAMVGRGFLAREMGEAIGAAECIADAEDLIHRVDWTSTEDDERLALLQLATLVATVDAKRASHYVDRYKAIVKRIHALNVAAHGDPLYRAKEAHAFGLVAKENFGPAFAIPFLRDAHRLFCSVRSNWRAAAVAMDIYDLEGDTEMLRFASATAATLPQSWLARRVAKRSMHTS